MSYNPLFRLVEKDIDKTDPTICHDCGVKLKPLFVGMYCPNDCDRPKAKAKPDTVGPAKGFSLATTPVLLTPVVGRFLVRPGPGGVGYNSYFSRVSCRDANCPHLAVLHLVSTLGQAATPATSTYRYVCPDPLHSWDI